MCGMIMCILWNAGQHEEEENEMSHAVRNTFLDFIYLFYFIYFYLG